jgi:hypothetical protein|tara:strand:+ start:182 stop:352 length:171 start_codon:yes stop_codon:yes gene_type:complete
MYVGGAAIVYNAYWVARPTVPLLFSILKRKIKKGAFSIHEWKDALRHAPINIPTKS